VAGANHHNIELLGKGHLPILWVELHLLEAVGV
jgi:hypothetical protein